MVADDPELDRLEQQATAVARRVLAAFLLLIALAVAVGGVSRAQFGSGHFHLQNPFNLPPYNALDSLVARYWLYGLFVTGAAVLATARYATGWLGLRFAGILSLAIAAILAVVPITSYPEAGPGTCRALIFGRGTYGDDDEVCYDVRSTRAGDVGILVGAGAALIVLGALRPRADASLRRDS